MAIFRVNKTKNYTVMSNVHLRDKRLSLKARGLLSFILALPDDWNYSVGGLVAATGEGETTIKSGLKELKQYGYIRVTKQYPQKGGGKIEYIYDIFEHPGAEEGQEPDNKVDVSRGLFQEGCFLHLENQALENLPVEKHPVYKDTNNQRTKNKELKKQNKDTNSCAEPETDSTPPVITIILNDKSEYPFYQTDIDQWQELFPGVNVVQAMRNIKAWCINNPTKRKTRAGIRRFVNAWLARDQDRPAQGQTVTRNGGRSPKNIFAVDYSNQHEYDPEEYDKKIIVDLSQYEAKGG